MLRIGSEIDHKPHIYDVMSRVIHIFQITIDLRLNIRISMILSQTMLFSGFTRHPGFIPDSSCTSTSRKRPGFVFFNPAQHYRIYVHVVVFIHQS